MPLMMRLKCSRFKNISVSTSVSGLQFDISMTGEISPIANIVLRRALISGNTYRVLAFVTSVTTFSGAFMKVTGIVTGITNVLASDIDGNEIVGVTVSY